MDQLKGEMLNASTLHDICTKGIGSLTRTDQAQAQGELIDYTGSTPSNVLVREGSEEGLHDAAMEEVMIQNSRQSATTFSWLMQNYEASQGYSLPRCLIYEHYLDFCQRNVLQPVNAASFGKTIRQVFPDIRTRRLGTRGQSKYHYYGIKVRCDSPYYSTLVASQRMSLPCPTSGQWLAKTFSSMTPSPTHSITPTTSSKISADIVGQSQKSMCTGGTLGSTGKSEGGSGECGEGEASTVGSSMGNRGKSVSSATLQKVIGQKTPDKGFTANANREPTLPITPLMQSASSSLLPSFPTSHQLIHLPHDVDHHQVDEFLKDYRVHCAIILEVIMRGGLDEVVYYCQTYWDNLPIGQRRLLDIPSMCDALAVCDTYLYHTIVSVLIPGTLNTVPQSLLQGIRHFSHEVPQIKQSVLKSFPDQLLHSKMPAMKRFSRLLKRKTSLAHLAQASRSALAVDITITQMRLDWERRTEHDTACSQLIWTMPEMKGLIHKDIRAHMDSFKKLLESRATVEDHIKWVEEVRSFYVEKGYPRGSAHYEKAERAFFMGWSYVCSLIIRDQTLRSATSFGSFHLLNLLYEEYLLYVIEVHRYQREEVALWNHVMDVNMPMAEGYLLADVDLDLDDCGDILEMSSSSMMSIGAGDDIFDDDAILPASRAVNAVPLTVPDKLASTQMIDSTVESSRSGVEDCDVTKHVKAVLPTLDIISMAYAASFRPGGNESPVPGGMTELGPSLTRLAESSKKPISMDVESPSNATTEKKITTLKETSTFVTTKLIRATLLPQSDQKPLTPSGSASANTKKGGEGLKETPAAPPVLTLNVPMLPGLDLHKGQFLTAGDGNKYIINDVQTVLQPAKNTTD
eukprot:XP_003723712.1 PREDICTED: DNA-binding protein RFX2 isoform X1 [Strongylocentrotus purpuratus]